MYYAKIAESNTGLSNQICILITSIILARNNNHKVVIVDNFLNDVSKKGYTPISHIFNIEKINIFLKKNYDIIIADKYDVTFELNYVKYGNETAIIDITNNVKQHHVVNNNLFISKNTILNDIQGDPCFDKPKKLFLNYKINNYIVKEVYEENLKNDIIIDVLNANYNVTYSWSNYYNTNMFDNILANIEYNNSFIEKSQKIFKHISSNVKINVIHLRLEDDGINHWSKVNNMSPQNFKMYIENKYIQIIKTHINKNDINILLSQSLSNAVIDFLTENQYKYTFSEKFFEDREKNAIVDLLISKNCNNLFIGNFNFEKLNGSTFSYYITKLLTNSVKKISIDLDGILKDECIFY